MKLTDKIKSFLKPKKSEEKKPETVTPVKEVPHTPAETVTPAKEVPHTPAETVKDEETELLDAFLSEITEEENDGIIHFPYRIDENEIYHPQNETEEKTVIIPEGVTYIPKEAFKGKSVRSIQLPESLLWIEAEAFSETALEEIVLPSSLQFLQEKTFAKCQHLKKVVMPSGLLGIGRNVFQNCPSLGSIAIPETVRYLDGSYFSSPDLGTSLKQSFEPTIQRLNNAFRRTACPVPKSAKEKLYFGKFLFQYHKGTKLSKKFPEQLKADYFLELGDTQKIYRNINGKKIFSILERLPIFDSGDAMYSSYEKIYLFRSPDKNGLSAIVIEGGYEISSVMLYEKIFPTNEKIKYLLDALEII